MSSIIGSLEEDHNRALKLHSIISANRENPNIRMGVPFVRYWDELANKLERGFFRKPLLVNARSWVRNIVLEDPKAFACLAPHIRLELIVDGKLRYWSGWGREITRNPESPTDFLYDKLGPYWLEFLLGENISLFKGALEDFDSTEVKQTTSIREENQPAKPKHQLSATGRRTGQDRGFIHYDNGTVLDTRTSLMWAAKDNGSDINWADTKSYCENYRGGGYTDWRMPTQDELAGLYETGSNNNLQITTWFIWASETHGSEAAIVYFLGGHRLWNLQSCVYDRRALPVRSAKGKTDGLAPYRHHVGENAKGISNGLQKHGLAGMIPKNAYEQYNKWRRKDPSLSEGQIAQGIFNLRYIAGNPILNQAGNNRLLGYMASDFECKTLMDFCLVSLDIEGEINPSDGSAFFNTAEIINEELDRLGFKVGKDHINSFVDRWSNRQLTDGF
jgi:hypothetical protein